MLKSITIKNFKSLKETGKIDIKPITFFVGPNSSGKSSALQVLLALRQTLKSSDEKSPLILRDYIDLGSFKDIIWNHNEKSELEFSLEDSSSGKYVIKYRYPHTGFNAGKIIVKFFEYEGYFPIANTDVTDKKQLQLEDSKIHIQIKWINEDNYSLTIVEPKYSKIQKITGKLNKISNFSVPKYDFIRSKLPSFENMTKDELNAFQAFLLSTISHTQLMKLIFGIVHVGPSRVNPERVYTKSGATPTDVGKNGEFTVDMLLASNEKKNIVKKWLYEFDIASDLRLEELKEGSKRYELILKDCHTGIWVTIADVGFGTSQLLPIIVECFNENNSTVLIEQPEIHLHPKGQAKMGDLLVDAITNNSKKALIVETHSDLIISRVCTRIAKGDILPQDVAIYYFEPTKKGTEIHTIQVNEDGEMMNFPDGFFEERFKEVIDRNNVIFDREDVNDKT